MDTNPLLSIPPPTRLGPPQPERFPRPVRALVVADAMLTTPKIFDKDATVAEAQRAFADTHVHALILVQNGVLLSVVERGDLRRGPRDNSEPALRLGSLAGRTVDPLADLEAVRSWMLARQRRRLAVVDIDLHLIGLLCMKRSYRGFCSDADVCSRTSDPAPPYI